MNSQASGISLYVHWPFCLAKCPYCDFNSHVAETIDHKAWRRALLTELDHFAARPEAGAGEKYLTSIFFGGGTPSLMEPETVAAIIERAGDHWKIDANIEITLEANPTSVEAGRLADFFAAGANRASLGIQSLDDAALKFLGREHSAAEALKALETAKRIFPRISFDLIYGRPDETAEEWRDELSQALDFATDHLSLYQLTLEKGTPFYAQDRDVGLGLPGENIAADLYEMTLEMMALAGLPAYEISNHARPGFEARHNLDIWRGGDYMGIGPGAHGRLTGQKARLATRQISNPANWLAQVEGRGHGGVPETALSKEETLHELLLTGLRLTEGISNARFYDLTGLTLEAALDDGQLERLTTGGFLIFDEAGLRTTDQGRLCLNTVLGELLG